MSTYDGEEWKRERTVQVRVPIRAGELARIANLKPYKVVADLLHVAGMASIDTELSAEEIAVVGQKNNIRFEIISPE